MTTISIFGKGNMGKVLAERFTQAGNQVTTVGRNENAKLGEIVIFAVPFAAVDDIINQYRNQLADKIVIDITNPVDFATMDDLVVPPDSSAAAVIAQKLPASAVIKAFNTNLAANIGSGKVADLAQTTVLLAGDCEQSKAKVTEVLNGSGLAVKDAGSLKRARELEALGFLQITLAVREQIGWTGGFALFA
ncbi:diguanylate cyclase [Actinobacillus succinogenes]|uniref:NADP oxidoreductase coenzyme F420-dependent n=1 Tax=Actinobacillus succinogenes (strain ATCC 55618 / DSM 22257 / CCUG 43843 / 130Z) TaxID=339671 RepID=A6VKL8_ACTSZ|nr:NADPH-dependent F420 reductase [Actinobacillus succinogenes]ABR73515.1 NADP oxidoreductase coenzyme F420-dependent [Actinobacillus succinogenes 130Z]PHI40022.1 diguanylate cyclase [Actinobacillus succinogenes]